MSFRWGSFFPKNNLLSKSSNFNVTDRRYTVHGSRYPVAVQGEHYGTRYTVLGTRYTVHGTRWGSRDTVHGTSRRQGLRYMAHGTQYKVNATEHGTESRTGTWRQVNSHHIWPRYTQLVIPHIPTSRLVSTTSPAHIASKSSPIII